MCEAVCERLCAVEWGGLCDGEVHLVGGAGPGDGGAVDGDGDGDALKDMALLGRRAGGIHAGGVDGSLAFDGAGPPATMLPSIVCLSLPLPAPSVPAALTRCTSSRDLLSPSSLLPRGCSMSGAFPVPRVLAASPADEKDTRVRPSTMTGQFEGCVSSTTNVPTSGIASRASRHNKWRVRASANTTRRAASGSPSNPAQHSRTEEAGTAECFKACTAPSPNAPVGVRTASRSTALDADHEVRRLGGRRSRGSSTHPSTCTWAICRAPFSPLAPKSSPETSSSLSPPCDKRLAEQRKTRSESRTSMATPSPGRSCNFLRSARDNLHRPVPCSPTHRHVK